MKKLLFLLLALMPMMAEADIVEIGGIKYDIDKDAQTAEVIGNGGYYAGSIVIPASVPSSGVGYPVTRVGDYAFEGCYDLTSVTLPESITSIGEGAFFLCENLTSLNIPESVTHIGDDAFGRTPWYDNLPDGLVYFGRLLFAYIGSMPANTSIEVKEGTIGIAGNAFSKCSGLTSVTIPSSVTHIGDYAFENCTSLTSVTIPESVTRIESYTFMGCSSLTSVTIPTSVTSIGQSAFEKCTKLTSVTIPDAVNSIGYYAFKECTGLTSVTIPDGVTRIEDGTFKDCTGLTEVTIGYDVSNIESYAFENCLGLTKVTCLAEEVPNTRSDAFYGVDLDACKLSVLTDLESAYRAATPWKDFGWISGIIKTKCAAPVITFDDGQFKATSQTRGAACQATYEWTTYNGRNTDAFTPIAWLKVTAYATAKNYYDSDTAEETFDIADILSKQGDLNGDGKLSAGDIARLVDKMNLPLNVKADEVTRKNTLGGITGLNDVGKKCATPVITFDGGKVKATSTTDGAKCPITYSWIIFKGTKFNPLPIPKPLLTVKAYATAPGYEDSETAEVTFDILKVISTPGDMNGDGILNKEDVTNLVNKVLNQ